MAGRGVGKTRTGAEWIRDGVEAGLCKRIALVGQTAADARDVMIEGDSGIMSVSRDDFMPKYQPSKRRVVWPNGAIATTYSADKPRQLRGPQHDRAWLDEPASYRFPDAIDQVMFGLRLGARPQVLMTTTPANVAHIKKYAKDTYGIRTGRIVVTTGKTYENLHNLAPAFREAILNSYEGTRLGLQEIEGLLLEDVEGALWQSSWIEDGRQGYDPDVFPAWKRVIVAVDPSAGGEDECGIVVIGQGAKDGHAYVLEDRSDRMSPLEWAREVVAAYDEWEDKAPKITVVVEANQGGEMAAQNIRAVEHTPIHIELVWGRKGKHLRAEPIANRYQQGRVHHMGVFAKLEDELTSWVQGEKSPNRLDALVWGMTAIFGTGARGGFYHPDAVTEQEAEALDPRLPRGQRPLKVGNVWRLKNGLLVLAETADPDA